jgi:heme exporter protein CcmD
MDMSAPHFGFVVAAYALSVVFIGGLVAYVLGRDRSLRSEVARLEKTRRGDRP